VLDVGLTVASRLLLYRLDTRLPSKSIMAVPLVAAAPLARMSLIARCAVSKKSMGTMAARAALELTALAAQAATANRSMNHSLNPPHRTPT
jgi:hypothetical protein